MTNMITLWFRLQEWNLDINRFPPPLALLSAATNQPALFVCPSTGHVPGTYSNLQEWGDYIYVTGPSPDEMFDVALLICPPENHGGKFGHVAWGAGPVVRLGAEQVRSLIRKPWCMPTAGRGEGADDSYFSNRVEVNIPDRDRALYGH